MRYAIFDTATGRIDRIIVAPVGVASATASCAPGEDFVSANAGETDRTHYVDGFALVAFPPRPTKDCWWDWSSKTWVANIEAARRRRKAEIERERDRRIVSPVIQYDGKSLDADDESIDRLAKKLSAITAYEMLGEAMPIEQLFWRDHDNITHSFSSHDEYKFWLAGLAVALDARGTAAFAWSWQKKALIDQASTAEQVEVISLVD